MRKVLEVVTLIGVGLFVLASATNSGASRRSTRIAGITRGGAQVGMEQRQVIAAFGEPDKRSARGRHETWVYADRARDYLYTIEFERGVVTAYDGSKAHTRTVIASSSGLATVVTTPNAGAAEVGGVAVAPVVSSGGYGAGYGGVSISTGGGSMRGARAAAGPVSVGGQAVCRNNLDCDDGWCRDRGDGIKVCMDEGRHGDFCRSGNDCGDGFCKARSDGYKVCMDEGQSGEVCHDGNDCAFSLSCRDRGDGWKVCL